MIEMSRRHGHYDARFARSTTARRKPHLHLVPALDEPVDGDESIDAWEDEGGLAPMPRDVPPEPRLEWAAFSDTFFPGRHRHDFEAVKAYEAYRATGAVPAAPVPERVAVAVAVP
jgi:hypothetical protein